MKGARVMSENAIEIKGLNKSFGKFSIEGLSLELPKGCIMGLIGENGAGKSTLIRLIMNASNADSGEISVLGTDIKSEGFIGTKDDIGIVLDTPCFAENLKAARIDKIMSGYYSKWSSERFFELLERFEIDPKIRFNKLSKGMKMKLSIVAALSHEAKLLILDEPTSGLDPMVRDELLDILIDFTRDEEHSVLISSHIISDLEKICDLVAFLHKGRLIINDEKDALLERYSVVKLTEQQLKELPKNAYIGARKGKYSCEALMENSKVPEGFTKEHTTLEEIILFTVRDEREAV